jgi:hypothetical protein
LQPHAIAAFTTTDLVSAFSPVKLPGSDGSFIGMQVALTRCLAFRQNCYASHRNEPKPENRHKSLNLKLFQL